MTAASDNMPHGAGRFRDAAPARGACAALQSTTSTLLRAPVSLPS
jgi:hypothetical protein